MIDQSVFRAVSPGEESHKIASDGRAQIKWGYIFDSGHRQAVAYRSFRVDSFRVDSKVGDYLLLQVSVLRFTADLQYITFFDDLLHALFRSLDTYGHMVAKQDWRLSSEWNDITIHELSVIK